MPHIYLAALGLPVRQLTGNNRDALHTFCLINEVPPTATLMPGRAYSLELLDARGRGMLKAINSTPWDERHRLAACIDQFSDKTSLLAAVFSKALESPQHVPTVLGGATTAAQARADGFTRALRNYQQHLLKLHEFERSAKRHSNAGQMRLRLQNNVRQAHYLLNQAYHLELRRIVNAHEAGKNRGTALTGPERGITLAIRSRGRGLHVADMLEARALMQFASAIRWMGRGAIALDLGARVKTVRKTFHDGNDWMREASVQATGFGFGGAAGAAAGKATVSLGIAAIASVGLTLTPVGWLLLIGTGITAGIGSAVIADKFGQAVAASLWARGH